MSAPGEKRSRARITITIPPPKGSIAYKIYSAPKLEGVRAAEVIQRGQRLNDDGDEPTALGMQIGLQLLVGVAARVGVPVVTLGIDDVVGILVALDLELVADIMQEENIARITVPGTAGPLSNALTFYRDSLLPKPSGR